MQYKNKLFIDGKWLDGEGGATFDVINPASEEVITKVASAGIEDAKKAINAAEIAFESWAKVSPRDRSVILRKAYELFMDKIEHFAELITLENGKAYGDAKGEALYSAEFFRWYSEEAVRGIGQISHAPATGARIVVQYKPIGISVLVTPWNYPAAMGTRKIAPAIAAGCPVIIKPASETPLTMLELMPLLEEAGVPKGLISVLPSRNTSKLVDHLLHRSPRLFHPSAMLHHRERAQGGPALPLQRSHLLALDRLVLHHLGDRLVLLARARLVAFWRFVRRTT